MKKLVLSIIILLTMTLTISAQQRRGGGPGGFNPSEMVEREKENVLKKVENLSADQKTLIEGIYDEFGETISETFEEIRKTRNFSEMRTKMQGLREEKDLLVKDVLNDEQYQAYLEVVEASRPRRQRPNNQPDGDN